jgi:hypothetical protein
MGAKSERKGERVSPTRRTRVLSAGRISAGVRFQVVIAMPAPMAMRRRTPERAIARKVESDREKRRGNRIIPAPSSQKSPREG